MSLRLPFMFLFWTLAMLSAHAQQTAEILEAWSEDPPDITELDAEELALLPWLDLRLAESIVELHELGALREFDDLLLIPGMDRATVDALRPLIRLARRRQSPRVQLAGRSLFRAERPRHDFRLDADHAALSLRLGKRAGGRSNGSLHVASSLGERGWEVIAGDFAISRSWQLSGRSAGSRSRSAPASFPRTKSARAHRSLSSEAGWRGFVATVRGAQGSSMIAVDGELQRASLLAEFVAGVRTGAYLELESTEKLAASLWMQSASRDESRWRIHWAPRRAAALAWSSRAPLGELGFAATTARPSPVPGRDPISGRSLDREHTSWQVHLRTRGAGGARTILHRRIRRAGQPAEIMSLLELSAADGSRRWRARLRHDVRGDELSSLSVRLRWESADSPWGGRVRAGAAAEAHPGGEFGRLWEIGLLGLAGARLRWGLQLAFSDGGRSIPHVGAPPGSLARMHRPGPGAFSLTSGLSLPTARGQLSAWVHASAQADGGPPVYQAGVEYSILGPTP
jgi:hypothetical protein